MKDELLRVTPASDTTSQAEALRALYLDDSTMRFIEARLASIRTIEAELNGALALLIEMNGLQGRWQLDLANRRLIPSEAPQQLKAA